MSKNNFTQTLCLEILQIPISYNLEKIGTTQPQKSFQNGLLKSDNVSNKFGYSVPDEIIGKSIILFDDIFDSGATIKEISKMLTRNGANKIAPLVIARTVGGDI